jgi:transcriptional regulator GlxA family with amidase domain
MLMKKIVSVRTRKGIVYRRLSRYLRANLSDTIAANIPDEEICLRLRKAADGVFAALEEDALRRIKSHQFIADNYADPTLLLPQLARHLDLPNSTCSSWFCAAFGMTLNDYVSHLRVEAAQSILRNESFPIATVCEIVGFASAGQFSLKFREYVGLSPREYRQRYTAE